MKLLAWLTDIFISVFGVTRPRPEQRRLANLVIGGILLTAILVACGVVGFLLYAISSH
jgi:hypothetical protein